VCDFIKINKEIIFLIIFLFILSIIIWGLKLYITMGIQNIITLYAVIVALATAILATMTNKGIINEMKTARELEFAPYIVVYFD
jgi:amino acid transporter